MAKKYLSDLSEHRDAQRQQKANDDGAAQDFGRRFQEWGRDTLPQAADLIRDELEEIGHGFRAHQPRVPPSTLPHSSLRIVLEVLQYPERKGEHEITPAIAQVWVEGNPADQTVQFGGWLMPMRKETGEAVPLDDLDADTTATHIGRMVTLLLKE